MTSLNDTSRRARIAFLCGTFAVLLIAWVKFGNAFTGPAGSAGVGAGALGVDAANNISVGTSTTQASTKLFVLASSTGNSDYAMRVFQPGSGWLFAIRNDNVISIGTSIPGGASTNMLLVGGDTLVSGTLTATALVGTLSGNLNSSNVTAGVFASGNFAFPSSLGVGTSTQVGLPQKLSVYGGGYFTGNVGIGTSAPNELLEVAGSGRVFIGNGGGASRKGLLIDAVSGGSYARLHPYNYGTGATIDLVISPTGSGVVSIGTYATSSSKLTVAGTIESTSGGFKFPDGTTQATAMSASAAGGWTRDASGIVRLSTSTDNVGIGTASPTAKLDVQGTAFMRVGEFYANSNVVAANSWQRFSFGYGIYWNNTNGNYTVTDTTYNQATFSDENGNFVWTLHSGALTSPQTYAQWHAYDRMTLTAAGNLGIGTASPSYPLTVQAGSDSLMGLARTGASYPAIFKLGTDSALVVNAGNSDTLTLKSGNVGIGVSSPARKLEVGGTFMVSGNGQVPASVGGALLIDSGFASPTTGRIYVGDGTGWKLYFSKRAASVTTDLVTIQDNGNVGIGTASPGQKLTVAGTIESTSGGFKFPDGTTQVTAMSASAADGWTRDASGIVRLSTSTDKVGIGTASPSYPLTVQGGSDTLMGLVRTGATYPAIFKVGTDSALVVNAGNSDVLTLKSGNVGIGSTGPSEKLEVAGGLIKIPQASGVDNDSPGITVVSNDDFLYDGEYINHYGLGWHNYNDGGGLGINAYLSGYFGIDLFTGGQERLRINANGNVGIGTVSPGQKLTVAGTIESTSGGFKFPDGTTQATAMSASAADGWTRDASGIVRLSTSTDKVGIGTTSPGYKLTIAGTGSVFGVDNQATFTAKDTAGTYQGYLWPRWSDNATYINYGTGGFYIRNNSSVSTMRMTDDNKVGIGTASPAGKLDVSGAFYTGTGQIVLRAQDGANEGGQLNFSGAGTNRYFYLDSYAGTLRYISQDATGESVKFVIGNDGNVGIGTTAPGTLLSVGGATTGLVAIFGGGSGKIDAGTIDPPYTINGVRYATYLPAMTGVKEETTGTALCRFVDGRCAYTIDFARAAEGSDLWLFAKTTDLKRRFEVMTVLLTPSFDGKVWYEKKPGTLELVFYGETASGSEESEISYRLTAPRFDAEEWPNRLRGEGSPGFILNDTQ